MKVDVRDLMMKRARLGAETQSLLAAERPSKADMAQAKAMLDECDSLKGQIDGLHRAMGITGDNPPPMDGLIGSQADNDNHGGPAAKKDYRSMFGASAGQRLDRGQFKDFEDFLSTVHNSGRVADSRLGRVMNVSMSESVPSDGGFLVPEEFSAMLLDNSLEDEIVRPRAQVWPMKSETRKIPAWAGSDHTGSLYGGFVGVWLAELATGVRVTPKVRQMLLTARKLGCYTQSSNELIADGLSYEASLGAALSKAIGWYLDLAFLTGDGAGKPLGVLNSPSLITIPKENGQAAATVCYENLTKMFARLLPACVKNSVWVANQTCIPQLLALSVAVGTGGSFVPAMTKSNGEFEILTRPVVFTEKTPALGTKGDIMLADFSSGYAVGLRKEISIDRNVAPGWTEDATDYRAIVRAEGMSTFDKAITPKNGDPLSWAVALAAR